MLNSVSHVAAPAATRATDCRPATGAFPPGWAGAVRQRPSGARVFTRPGGVASTGAFGLGRKAAVHGLPQGQPSVRKQQFLIMARRAAASGGALGPHPARDPV
jgi:hypothetical protein